MKKYSYLFFILILFTLTSCLKGGLEDLPEFEGNAITAVRKVEYRFKGTNSSGVSGEPYLEYLTLDAKSDINKESRSISIEVTVPGINTVFTAAEREKCAVNNIVVMLSLETAARLAPVGNSPKMGVPGDWSKPNKYAVTAANGDTAEWTIEVTKFNK